MRRKIALLLAFAMVLSILPMNVFAAAPTAVLGGGSRTGMLAEPAGPARNVRHFNDGVAVGRQWIVTAMTPPRNGGTNPASNLTGAPQGNLRNIFADAAYFAGAGSGAGSVAWITMNIHNVDRWLGWPRTSSGWSPAVSSWATLATNANGGIVSEFATASPPAFDPPPAGWHDSPTLAILPELRTTTAATNFATFVRDNITANGNMVPEATVQLVNAVNILGQLGRATQEEFLNTFFAVSNNPSLVSISYRRAPVSMGLGDNFPTLFAGIRTISATSARLILWRPFTTVNPVPTTIGSVTLLPANREALNAFMTSTDNWVQLPVEYVTRIATNDEPVFLNFFENSGWPQAGNVRPGGGVPGRTDLTAVNERRFDFTKGDGDRRTFHRYQRGLLPGIRIAEGAQGAFDNEFWWIELSIQQTGFFFTEDSMEDIRFSTRWGGAAPAPTVAWGGTSIATGTLPNNPRPPQLGWWDGWRPATTDPTRNASQIGMLRIEDGPVRREPVDGPNRYTKLVFGVRLPGAVNTNLQRTVNDWLDINYLSIIADDRAREGKVEVKVDLYRANAVVSEITGGFIGTIPGLTGWNWVQAAGGPPAAPASNQSGVGTTWWGLHPAVNNPSIPTASPFLSIVNLNQAQARGESLFVYQRSPLRYERFNSSNPDHLAAADQFTFLPSQFGVDPNNSALYTTGVGFRWGGAPGVNALSATADAFVQPSPEAITWATATGRPLDLGASVGRTLATLNTLQRANFWRVAPPDPANNPLPRYFVYASRAVPTGSDEIAMRAAFDRAIQDPTNSAASIGPNPPNRPTDNGFSAGQFFEHWPAVPTWQLAGTLQWQQQNQTITLTPDGSARQYFERGLHVADGIVHVGDFGSLGLEFEIHPDDSAEDFYLLSGRRDWQFSREVTGDGRRPIGVVEQILDNQNHLTARARLRELSAGALAATGSNPVTFEFNEGIQILGARIWTNDANFVPRNRFNEKDGEVLFGDRLNVADSFLGAVIDRNVLTLRPEIGTPSAQEQRWRPAEITVQFYLSVMPGYVYEFIDDAIEVTVTASDASDLTTPFTKSVPIAFAVDPITVETDVATVGAISPAEFGSLHVIPINDIVITEVDSRNLEVGTRLWVGVEGGISRGFGAADHISLTAGSVEVDPPGSIGIGPLRSDTHGAYVEITRVSNVNTNGTQIIFRDVKVSGRVFSETEYNIIVAGNSVAANWEEYLWLDGDMPTGIARGGIHGFFHEEPYMTPGFVFAGDDIAIVELPAPAPPAPAPAPAPVPPASMGPVTLTQNVAFTRPNGDQVFPPFEMVRIPANSESATAFVSVRVVADILGWELDWDETARRATFTMLSGQTVAFTFDQTTADVNGVATPMLTASPAPGVPGSPVAARVTNDGRLMVPIRFFRELGVNVQWVQNAPTPQIVVHQGPLTP